MDKKNIDNANIMEKIDDFEDYVERLYLSSEVSYDKEFHKEVISKYRNIVETINNSSLNIEDKGFMMEILAELFNEYKNLNITIDNHA